VVHGTPQVVRSPVEVLSDKCEPVSARTGLLTFSRPRGRATRQGRRHGSA
jgi:hypothetical protein